MDKYTQLLEFFMENGVYLSKEQINELRSVCTEVTKSQKNYFSDRVDKIVDGGTGHDAMERYNKDASRHLDTAREYKKEGVKGKTADNKVAAKMDLINKIDNDQELAELEYEANTGKKVHYAPNKDSIRK